MDWKIINVIPYECARETSLQSLQFQILNNFFPCNYQLYVWKIEPNPTCGYCNSIDTLFHYFVYCEEVNQFWKYLKNWFVRVCDFVIGFEAIDILLGTPNQNNDACINILNFVILFAKHYILRCRKTNKPIDLYTYQVMLKNRMEVEKYIYCSENRANDFNVKWSILTENI